MKTRPRGLKNTNNTLMLFKDSDVERKFFHLFLCDEGEDKDEDEEDNIVDKPLIKWTRAPKTVARARKEIVDVIDDETKNKLRIVSVASPLEKCHKIEATCDGSNGEVYRVSVQMKTNTSFGGGDGDDDEDKKKNDNVFEEVTEATCECAHANKLSGKTRGRCKHSCAVLMVGLDHRRQSRIQKKTLMNNNNSPKGKALGANGDSSSGVTTGRMKRARKLPMSLLGGGGKSGDGGEVEKSKKNKTAKATTQKTIRAVQTTTTKKKDDDEKADFLEDLLDDDGDEEEEEDEDGKKERLKKKRKKKRGRRRETSSSDSESDFEPFGAEVPMEHRMPTMSQRPTPPRRRRGRRGDADDGDDDEIEDMVEISDFSDGEELPPRRPAGIDGVAKAHANKKKALEAAECMTLETLRAACERRVERAASAKEIEEEEEEEEAYKEKKENEAEEQVQNHEEDGAIVIDDDGDEMVLGTQNRSPAPPQTTTTKKSQPMTMEEMQKLFMFGGSTKAAASSPINIKEKNTHANSPPKVPGAGPLASSSTMPPKKKKPKTVPIVTTQEDAINYFTAAAGKKEEEEEEEEEEEKKRKRAKKAVVEYSVAADASLKEKPKKSFAALFENNGYSSSSDS